MIDAGISSEDELTAVEAAAKAEVDDAVARAMASPVTPSSETMIDVFADESCVPKRGVYPMREAEGALPAETKTLTMAGAIVDAQDVAMAANPEVFLLGEDVGDPHGGTFGTNKGLQTKYGPLRVRNTPISESAIIGAAIGSSIAGMNPIAEIMFCDFMGVCLDQIANHAAKQRYMSGSATHAPMTIRMQVGGAIGGFGAQHSQSLEAWLTHVPGIKVLYPSNPIDAKGMLLSAVNDPDPVVVLESIMLLFTQKAEVPTGDYRIPLGRGEGRARGQRCNADQLWLGIAQLPGGSRRTGQRRHQCRSHRPALAGSHRLLPRSGIGQEDQARGCRSCRR